MYEVQEILELNLGVNKSLRTYCMKFSNLKNILALGSGVSEVFDPGVVFDPFFWKIINITIGISNPLTSSWNQGF
jgi:hypothetical protein